jgi:integrase
MLPRDGAGVNSLKEVLTDRKLKSLLPAPSGKRTMIWDLTVPSFGVRITDKGSAIFIVMKRIKGGGLLRRTIGSAWQVPWQGPKDERLPVSLADAREEARKIIFDISRGIDPKRKLAVESGAAQKKLDNHFERVAEAFIAKHVEKLRSKKNVISAIQNKMIPAWKERAIAEITKGDVIKLVREGADQYPTASYHLLAYIKKLFSWAVAQNCYDIEISPCDHGVTASSLIGKREPRKRILSDAELKRIWETATSMRYPFGDLTQLLLLTGQRLRECANAEWKEIDLEKELWTIPAGRMKGNIAHEVPLSPMVVEQFRSIPRGIGPFVFSTTGGLRPVSGFSKAKIRLDSLLGEDLETWTFHDIRRTMRTGLGGLPVPTNVAELVIAHTQPGMHKIYDLHRYRAEKRQALQLWEGRLQAILDPIAENIVELRT